MRIDPANEGTLDVAALGAARLHLGRTLQPGEPMRVFPALLISLAASGALGCPAPRNEGLIVNLQTDFRAGVEFDDVLVEVDDAMPHHHAVTRRDRFSRPEFITRYSGIAEGPRVVRVALMRAGRERVVRSFSIPFRGSYLVTAVVSRSCLDVECEDGFTCAGERCGPEDCVNGTEPSCPAEQCLASSDCRSTTSCAHPLCALSICLDDLDDSLCGAGEICVSHEGCVRPDVDAAPSPPDAGPPDVGLPDAAPPPVPSAPGTPSISVTIPGGVRSSGAGGWINPPRSSGNWFFAQGSASASCESGSSPQYRFQAQYTGTSTVYGWTGWMGPDGVMVAPSDGFGVHISVQARCVGPGGASPESSTAGGCRMRSGAAC